MAEFDYQRYCNEVNTTARTNMGSFLTTGPKDQYPKEHELLIVAAKVAHIQLGKDGASIRPGNLLSNLQDFEKLCVIKVKEEVETFLQDKVEESDLDDKSPTFSPLIKSLKNTEEGHAVFTWCSFLLFACMKHYHDFIEVRKFKEQQQAQNAHGAFSPRMNGGGGSNYNREGPREQRYPGREGGRGEIREGGGGREGRYEGGHEGGRGGRYEGGREYDNRGGYGGGQGNRDGYGRGGFRGNGRN